MGHFWFNCDQVQMTNKLFFLFQRQRKSPALTQCHIQPIWPKLPYLYVFSNFCDEFKEIYSIYIHIRGWVWGCFFCFGLLLRVSKQFFNVRLHKCNVHSNVLALKNTHTHIYRHAVDWKKKSSNGTELTFSVSLNCPTVDPFSSFQNHRWHTS